MHVSTSNPATAPRRRTCLRGLIATLALVSVIGLALTSGASAAPVVRVSGTDVGPDSGTTVCQPVDNSVFLLSCTTSGFVTNWSGDMTGTVNSTLTQLINCNSGKIEGAGVETFTGSVAGVGSGTVTWALHFRGTFDCSTGTLSALVGTGTITSGTGALQGLQGTLRFTLTTFEGNLSQCGRSCCRR